MCRSAPAFEVNSIPPAGLVRNVVHFEEADRFARPVREMILRCRGDFVGRLFPTVFAQMGTAAPVVRGYSQASGDYADKLACHFGRLLKIKL